MGVSHTVTTHPDSVTAYQVSRSLTGTWSSSTSTVFPQQELVLICWHGHFFWVLLMFREASGSLTGYSSTKAPCRHCSYFTGHLSFCSAPTGMAVLSGLSHCWASQCLSPSSYTKAPKADVSPLSVQTGGIQTSGVRGLQPSVKQHFRFWLTAFSLPRSQTPTPGTCKWEWAK